MRNGMFMRVGVAAILCVMCACNSEEQSTTKNSPLLGTWRRDIGPFCEILQFRSDGTCTRKLDVPTGLESHEGTWEVTSGDLEMAMSNGSPEEVRETHHFDVGGGRLVMHDEQEMVFVRTD